MWLQLTNQQWELLKYHLLAQFQQYHSRGQEEWATHIAPLCAIKLGFGRTSRHFNQLATQAPQNGQDILLTLHGKNNKTNAYNFTKQIYCSADFHGLHVNYKKILCWTCTFQWQLTDHEMRSLALYLKFCCVNFKHIRSHTWKLTRDSFIMANDIKIRFLMRIRCLHDWRPEDTSTKKVISGGLSIQPRSIK